MRMHVDAMKFALSIPSWRVASLVLGVALFPALWFWTGSPLAGIALVAGFVAAGHVPLGARTSPQRAARVTGRIHGQALTLAKFEALSVEAPHCLIATIKIKGDEHIEGLANALGARAQSITRGNEVAVDQRGFITAAFGPFETLSVEIAVQLTARLMDSLREPVHFAGKALRPHLSMGFVLPHTQRISDPARALEASELAQRDAQQSGTGSIRMYSNDVARAVHRAEALADSLDAALMNEEICPYFQPVICARTGKVSGVEALARWSHPERGILLPADFIPLLIETGRMASLAQSILSQALRAMNRWDTAGHQIGSVSVNFSADELLDPNIADLVAWELERHKIAAERLSIEIHETVLASEKEDMITRNIVALRGLGCQIDLDDFGTQNAGFGALRQFKIDRIKIDRQFVKNASEVDERRKMLCAICDLAKTLGVGAVAEGVETEGEREAAIMAGCTHLQGYGIAPPMSFRLMQAWFAKHSGPH